MDEDQFLHSDLAVHLSDIVAHIVSEKPDGALSLFESLSNFVHTGKMVPEADAAAGGGGGGGSAREPGVVVNPVLPAGCFTDVAFARKYADLVVPPKPPRRVPKPGEEEEEPEPEPDAEAAEERCDVANVPQEQRVFNVLGVGLRETEAYRVMVSIKRLSDRENVKTARFWGKIFAVGGAYHVAETEVDTEREPEQEEAADGAEEDEEGAQGKGPESILKTLAAKSVQRHPTVPAEPANQLGANRFRYYVTTDLNTWTRLPDVRPTHIQAARLVKKLFTGDLTAPVLCHPPFPGCEQEYLRAQIARISHACRVAPRGIYEVPAEEEGDEDGAPKTTHKIAPYETLPELSLVPTDDLPDADDDAWQRPAYASWGRGYPHDDLLQPASWVHLEPELLSTQGRTTEHKFPPPDDEDEDAAAAAEEEDAASRRPIELVSPVGTEVALDERLCCEQHADPTKPAWALKKGRAQPCASATQSYLVRSLRWPGAFCFAQCLAGRAGATHANTYVGFGVKAGATTASFSPPVPSVDEAAGAAEAASPPLQVDCTPDDELELAPPPPPPAPPAAPEGEEDEEHDED